MARKKDPNRLVTVHAGPAWDVELLAMQLEDADIPFFLPDKMTKTVDPFITGANPLSSRLQVRAVDAEQATVLIEEARERLKPAPLDDDDEDEEDDEEDDEVEWLATRTRWAALIGIGLPFAFFGGWLYLKACREHGRTSQAHGLTLAAFGLSVVALLTLIGALAWSYVAPTLVG